MYQIFALLSVLAALCSAVPFNSPQSAALAESPQQPVFVEDPQPPSLLARQTNNPSGIGQLLAVENGSIIDMSWLNEVPAGERANINVPGVVSNGQLINPAPPGSTVGASAGGSSTIAAPSASTSPAPSAGSSSSPATPSTVNGTISGNPLSAGVSSSPSSSSSTGTPTTTGSSSGAGGCPPNMKGVTFNGGFNPGMFDTIGAASDWITFGLNGANGADAKASAAYIPMMAFAFDVPGAISMVTGPNPPAWMLTFNEPDYSYAGVTPTMSPQDAASAIAPLLTAKTTTKFVAPVTADPTSSWLDEFYSACNCKGFFSAYNIHIYTPTSAQVTNSLTTFHGKYPDKPLWLTEVAPGQATPACSLGWDTVTTFMNDIYKFAAGSGFVDRVFWNTGNQIGGGDTNVCNSYLLDSAGNPSPLLKSYQAVNCQ